MKWLRGMSVLVATVLAVLVAPGLAFAHDVPDMTRTGSVSATLTYDDEAVPGGSVTLYRVGDVVQDDGDYLFVLSGAFAGNGVSVEDPQSADAARALADWAREKKPIVYTCASVLIVEFPGSLSSAKEVEFCLNG